MATESNKVKDIYLFMYVGVGEKKIIGQEWADTIRSVLQYLKMSSDLKFPLTCIV